MKQLILILLLAASCTKPVVQAPTTPSDVYYQLIQIDKDGKRIETPIQHASTLGRDGDTPNCDGDGHDGDGDDDDDDDHHTLPITIESITLQKISSTSYRLMWKATSEDNVSIYEVRRSFDSITWTVIGSIKPTIGSYEIVDNF